MNIIIFLIILAAVVAVWELTVAIALKGLSCSRSFTRTAVFEGEEAELVEIVRNDKPLIIPWLRLESKISPHIRFGKQDDLKITGEMYHCSLFTLFPYQQIKRRHKVKFLRRGSYDLGNASLTVGDILGIHRLHRDQMLHAPVLVYPRILDEHEIPLPISRMMGEMTNRRQLLQDAFLIRGIRPYQLGDPVRDIHWPATARTNEVQVRVHDYTAQTKLLVVLNVQRNDLQMDNYLSGKDETIAEYGISLAATLCIHALRNGMSAGFAANMPKTARGESSMMYPGDGTVQEDAILADFARLNVILSNKFPVLLEDLTVHSGLDIVILSRYDSDSIQQGMRKLRQCGNQVTLHLYEGG